MGVCWDDFLSASPCRSRHGQEAGPTHSEGQRKKGGLLSAAAARELMSSHCRWQRPTHKSSKTQGRLKAAEDNDSEEGRWRGMAAGSESRSSTLYKTVQRPTRDHRLAGRLLVKTILSQVDMFNPLGAPKTHIGGAGVCPTGMQLAAHRCTSPVFRLLYGYADL